MPGAGLGSTDLGDVPRDQYLRARGAVDAILYDTFRQRKAGVLAPRAWAEENLPLDTGIDGTVESWFARTEVVAECPPGTSLTVRLRFLQPQRRSVERYLPGTGFVPTSRLEVDDWLVTNADDAIPHERDVTVDIDSVRREPADVFFEAVGITELEAVRDTTGAVRGRIRRTCRPLRIRVQLGAATPDSVVPTVRLRVVVENLTPGVSGDAFPTLAAEHSLVATHCFLGLSDGGFVSSVEPPSWAAAAVAECTNIHAFPVLAGDGGRDDLVLSAPVRMPDYPHGEPRTLGDELDAAGAEPTAAQARPALITPATYPIGPLPLAGVASGDAHWVVLHSA
jgi:hypothetical protein